MFRTYSRSLGVRECLATSVLFRDALEEAFDLCTPAPEFADGLLPVFRHTGNTQEPVWTPTGSIKLFKPTLQLRKWVQRPDDLVNEYPAPITRVTPPKDPDPLPARPKPPSPAPAPALAAVDDLDDEIPF